MKKKLLSVSLVLILVGGCSSIAKGIGSGGDDLVNGVVKNVPKANPVVVSKASAGISNFIKQAGKSRGQQYIGQQVSNKQPISRQTLSDVIFDETVSELKKTAQRYVISEVKSLARAEADALIDEYNSQPSDAPMTSNSSNKEQQWQRYYKGCGGDYQKFERTYRDYFEKTWRETGARPRGCG